MILLSVHPLIQLTAVAMAFYAAWLGWRRGRSLHFGREAVEFPRDRHVLVGSLSLMLMLGGIAGGLIMVVRYLGRSMLSSGLHGQAAMVALPFMVFGLFSGFYLYLNPAKRIVLPALHGLNNLLIILFTLLQLITGLRLYLSLLAG
jgi:hypothetical protein